MWVFATEIMVSVPFRCFSHWHSAFWSASWGHPSQRSCRWERAEHRGDVSEAPRETQGTRRRIPGDTPWKYQIGGRAQGGMSLRSRGIWRLLCHFPPYTYSYLSCMSSYNIYDANSFPATILWYIYDMYVCNIPGG